MKKIIIILVLITSTIVLYASKLNDPHWGELSTCGKRSLIKKQVIVIMKNYPNFKGKVLDYTSWDVKIKNNNGTYIVPLTSIVLLQLVKQTNK